LFTQTQVEKILEDMPSLKPQTTAMLNIINFFMLKNSLLIYDFKCFRNFCLVIPQAPQILT
jgi:hypothetical protein